MIRTRCVIGGICTSHVRHAIYHLPRHCFKPRTSQSIHSKCLLCHPPQRHKAPPAEREGPEAPITGGGCLRWLKLWISSQLRLRGWPASAASDVLVVVVGDVSLETPHATPRLVRRYGVLVLSSYRVATDLSSATPCWSERGDQLYISSRAPIHRM